MLSLADDKEDVENGDGGGGGSLGVIGRFAGVPEALLSKYCMRPARAAISFSKACFSGVSGPGNCMMFAFEPLKAIRLVKDWSSEGLYCFARLERIPARTI